MNYGRIIFIDKGLDIRLYALRFRKKNVELILSKLEEFSIKLNIEMKKTSELKRGLDVFHQQYDDEKKVLKFFKNSK